MISFDLTEEQRMIRDTVVAFAAAEVRQAARPADETGAILPSLIEQSWELGLVRGALPEQFGGYGDARSAVTGAIVAEELAFGDLSIALHALAPRLLAFPVMEFGTDTQRARILADFAGDKFAAGTAALVEPRFDFDASALDTTATRDGSTFILDGVKCYVPLAAESATILAFAATNRDAGFAGMDAFLIPRDTPGLTVSAREQSTGIEAAIDVKPSYGLSDETVAAMLQDAFEGAAADQQVRTLREAQVEARQLIDATEAALAQDGEALLAPPERMAIADHIYALADIIETGGPDSIAALRSATDRLNAATQTFATQRMNASIQRALAGRRLEEFATPRAKDAS